MLHLNDDYPFEKAYVSVDKSFYMDKNYIFKPGETLMLYTKVKQEVFQDEIISMPDVTFLMNEKGVEIINRHACIEPF